MDPERVFPRVMSFWATRSPARPVAAVSHPPAALCRTDSFALAVSARRESSNAESLRSRSRVGNQRSRGLLMLIHPDARRPHRQITNALDDAHPLGHRNRSARIEQIEQV